MLLRGAARGGQSDDDGAEPAAASRARVAVGTQCLLRLDAKRLTSLKRDWSLIGGRAALCDFLYLMSKHAGSGSEHHFAQSQLLAALAELFRDMDSCDVGTGAIGWTGLSQRLMHTTGVVKAESRERERGTLKFNPAPLSSRAQQQLQIESVVALPAPLETHLVVCDRFAPHSLGLAKSSADARASAGGVQRRLALWRLGPRDCVLSRVLQEGSLLLTAATLLPHSAGFERLRSDRRVVAGAESGGDPAAQRRRSVSANEPMAQTAVPADEGDDRQVASTTHVLATASHRPLVQLWLLVQQLGGAQDCLLTHSATLPCKEPLRALTPFAGTLCGGGVSGRLYLWDVSTWMLARCVAAHSEEISGLVTLTGLNLFASGSLDRSIRVWGPTGDSRGAPLLGHKHGVSAIAFAEAQHLLISVGLDRSQHSIASHRIASRRIACRA